MTGLEIKRNKFDAEIRKLRDLTCQKVSQLESVSTQAEWFGLLERKVSGAEFNNRLVAIQGNFIKVNETLDNLITQMRSVYNTFDTLDQDYMTSIVANVKAIEKTSNDIRKQQEELSRHNEKLIDQQGKLDNHQIEIEANVSNIKKIVDALKIFKEKIESYEHLKDIDRIWKDCQAIQNDIQVVSDNIGELSNKVRDDIAGLEEFKDKLSTLAHLMEVDEIWQSTEDHKVRINRLEQESKSHDDKLSDWVEKSDKMSARIDENALEINELKDYKETLDSISHLQDVDSIWQSVEGHGAQLIEGSKRDEELAADIQKNRDEVNQRISETVQATNLDIEALTRKVTYSYWIAGGAAGLAIIELILLLAQVI